MSIVTDIIIDTKRIDNIEINANTGSTALQPTGDGSQLTGITPAQVGAEPADINILKSTNFIAGTNYQAPLVADTDYLTPTGDGSQLTGINTDLVSDTTPQLGGNLDLNGFDIPVSASVQTALDNINTQISNVTVALDGGNSSSVYAVGDITLDGGGSI